jgi:hypothetical protein
VIERIGTLVGGRSQNEARAKINELIEASNRQDRAIAFLLKIADQGDLWKELPAEDQLYWNEVPRG